MARHRAPVPEAPPVASGDVPDWLLAGPVGDEPLSALLEHARRREQWRRDAGLTTSEVNRLVRSRGPRVAGRVEDSPGASP